MKHEDFIVSMKGIQKSFGGVHALTDGELTLRKGEVLGLIGENGAGKSTLMKILSGVYQADAGVMMVDGKEVHYHEPRQALHDGICMIYQELNLVQHLSVGDNIFIGRESKKGWKLDRTKDNGRAEELLKELELDVSPNTIVNTLTVAKQQMIEIAKGISYDSKVLIMDEPTAALSINEIRDLFRVIQKLKAKGISIIYISHRLEELFEITDRITVMRDGTYINTFITKESSLPELIRSMVGREVSWEKKKHSNVAADAPVLLEVKGMESHAIKNASFKLRKGEILGIGGLMGAGRTELARLVFGADWRKHGKIIKNGEEIQIHTPHDAVKNGIGYISEDRKALGLALKLSVADNIAMPNWEKFTSHGVVNEKEEMRVASEMADRVMVKTPSVKQLVMNLSGGNQQKVAIAKWLLRDCDILIFDEPTRGIDIGAKSEIYNLMNALIAQGKSIIMISSEMQELLSMSDRIIVMCEGSITGELDMRYPVVTSPDGWFKRVFYKSLDGFPMGVIYMVILFVIASFMFRYTKIGKYACAIGSNCEATRLSGVDTRRWTMLVYIIAGVFAGLAGIFYSATYTSVLPGSGSGMEMNAIAAVVIGGTSLSGGSGTMLGTIIGVFIMAVLKNGLMTIGIQQQWQVFFTGLAVLLAVMLDIYRSVKLKRS